MFVIDANTTRNQLNLIIKFKQIYFSNSNIYKT